MKLLYAEDEPAMTEAVKDILEYHNYMVDAVSDGREALEYALAGDYDGIILDIMLPGKSGLEVLSELRQAGDRTPVLLLTAKSEVEDRIRGLDMGADDYLPKPFAMGELLARLDEAAEGEPERSRYSLSGAVTEAAEQYREPAQAAGLGLGVAVEPGIEQEGSPEAAAELVDILLDNAVKYAEPGTEIGLTLGREGGAAVLRVWNRCTQPPQEPERLFDRFYREDTARTQSAGGTGLGLSIARAIMEGEGGGLSARVKPGGTIEFEARWKSART